MLNKTQKNALLCHHIILCTQTQIKKTLSYKRCHKRKIFSSLFTYLYRLSAHFAELAVLLYRFYTNYPCISVIIYLLFSLALLPLFSLLLHSIWCWNGRRSSLATVHHTTLARTGWSTVAHLLLLSLPAQLVARCRTCSCSHLFHGTGDKTSDITPHTSQNSTHEVTEGPEDLQGAISRPR